MNIRSTFAVRATFFFAFAALSTLMLGGCNAPNSDLLENNRKLQERNQILTAENDSLRNLNDQLQTAYNAREQAFRDQADLIAQLRSGNKDALSQYDELLAKMQGLKFGSLDPTTDRALKDLAAQYSNLLEYDSNRGVLRFKSDLTFASGSDVVSDNARSALTQFASILNGAASGYDLRVVGHTDSQAISSGTARQHPTNMHLSAHRAISTRNVLVSAGVAPDRVEVAGRGEFDPLVPNNPPKGNTPQNRRVEIYLDRARLKHAKGTMPSTEQPARVAPAPAPMRSNEPEVMK